LNKEGLKGDRKRLNERKLNRKEGITKETNGMMGKRQRRQTGKKIEGMQNVKTDRIGQREIFYFPRF
jgi:hypothetical protein